jgi:GTPase
VTTIVIVGRPNVGKSTLFNRLIGRRKALVHNEPGVTRDVNYSEVDYEGKQFLLVDTGGIHGASEDPLHSLVEDQALLAIQEGDIVLLLVDGKEGVIPIEKDLAGKLRESGKKVVLVVNKVDEEMHQLRETDFYSLGISPMVSVSAEHGRGIDELLTLITKEIPSTETDEEPDDSIKIAIVGKPNVGKSSILNRILGQDRALVSNIPGTTRDPVDSLLTSNGRKFVIVDTAGIRKKSKTERGAELLSVILAKRALMDCHVALLVVDASKEPTHQDAYIAGLIASSKKGAVIVLNKWDLIEGEKMAKEKELFFEDKFAFVPYLPFIKASALTGKGIKSLFPKLISVYDNFDRQFPTSEINRVLAQITREVAPPTVKGKEFKIRYGTQVGKAPPTLALFVNSIVPPPDSYIRYVRNKLMDAFKLEGTPLIIYFRKS